jgi:hypothetical protein
MKQYISNLSEEINAKLQTIDLNGKDVLEQAAKGIEILENTLKHLKAFVIGYRFKDEAEEIHFFKEIKPKLCSKLLFYHKVHNIIMRRPAGSNDAKKNYLLGQLDRINDFFERNLEFHEYFRSGNIHLDKYYFLRGKPDIWLNMDSFFFDLDQNFSSCFDYKVAKILANDMLTIFLNTEIKKMDSQYEAESLSINFPKIKHTWTGTKTEFVELIYSLHTKGSIDYGQVELKELVDYFSIVFNTDAGDFYRIYLNIRNRKESRTLYLDSLRDNFNRKMDDDDRKSQLSRWEFRKAIFNILQMAE